MDKVRKVEKVVMVGCDVAPSKAFKMLQPALEERGIEVVSFLGHGKPGFASKEELEKATDGASIVLVGMSSEKEHRIEEIAACELAREKGIPFGCYSDTFGVYNRIGFEDLSKDASLLFVLNQDDAQKAEAVFPKAKIIASGNPTHEEQAFPLMSYKEARNVIGVRDDEKMILVSAGKKLTINTVFFGGVIEAAHHLIEGGNPHIVLGLHPGDPNKPEAYADLEKYSTIPVSIVTKEIILTPDLVCACDILVHWASGPEIGAIYQRKPIINHFTEMTLNRIYEGTKSREWPTCAQGVNKAVYGNYDLASMINICLVPSSSAAIEMRKKQEELYPPLKERGVVVKRMVDSILDLFS